MDEAAFARAKSKIDGLKMGFMALGGVVMAAAAGLQLLAKETADAAREAEHTAKQTGLTTQQVQGLGFAAEQSGVSAEEMRHGLIHLARSAMEAKQGSAEAALGFQQVGIHAAGADGKVRPMGDLLADVTAKFASMPDGTQKAALAMRLFGRAGAQLIPFFDKGPAGIAKLTAEAQRLGIVMSDKTIGAGVAFAETLGRMKAAVQGITYAIGSAMFPAFTRSTNAITKFIAANRQWLALKVRETFEAISQVLHGVADLFMRVYSVARKLWDSGGVGKTVLIGLAAAAVALLAPFTALAAMLALLAEDFSVYLGGKGRSVIGYLVLLFQALGSRLAEMFDQFKADPFGALRDWAEKFFDWMDEQGKALGKRLVDSIGRGVLNSAFGAPPTPTQATPADYADPKSFATKVRQFLLDSTMFGHPMFDAHPAEQMMFPSPSTPSGAGMGGLGGLTISIGALNLDASGGSDPAAFAQQLFRSVAPMLDEHWDTKMRETSAAVTR